MLHTECSLDDICICIVSRVCFSRWTLITLSHLDPQMSESSTLKHSKEMQILNNFQDFLLELEGKFVGYCKMFKKADAYF